MIDGSAYQVATPEEKQKTSNNIRKHLGLEDSKKDFTNPPVTQNYNNGFY